MHQQDKTLDSHFSVCICIRVVFSRLTFEVMTLISQPLHFNRQFFFLKKNKTKKKTIGRKKKKTSSMTWISLSRSEESEIERVRGQEDRVFIKVALIQREITNDLNISLRLRNTMTRCLFKTFALAAPAETAVCSHSHLIREMNFFIRRTLTFYFCGRSVGWPTGCVLLFTGCRKSFLESGARKKKEGGKSNRDPSPLSSQSVGVSVSRPVALNRATQLVTHFQPHSTHTLRFIATDTHTGLKI